MDFETSDSFQLVAKHYDELMGRIPYDFWLRYIKRLFKRHGVRPKRILDIACGTGSMSILLCRQGFDVCGFDKSKRMIDIARQKSITTGLEIDFQVQDFAEFSYFDQKFDAAISVFDSLNYVLDPNDLLSGFINVWNCLKDGGVFVFDLNSKYALVEGFFTQSNTDEDETLRYSWRSEYCHETNICTVSMRFFVEESNGVDSEFREVHKQYAYEVNQIRSMLKEAGFSKISAYRAYTFEEVTSTSDRIFYVAQKK